MVMELLDGRDLAGIIGEAGPLGVPLASGLVVQACQALSEAHGLGIVHRDLKPSNLFLASREDGTPSIKLLDFGLARVERDPDQAIMRAGAALGTPSYMAPEQMRSARDLDRRADIWALGVVLHELLSGRRPFPADDYAELCVQVAVERPAPLTGVPPEISAIVLRCLEKDPAHRFQSVVELAGALAPFCGERLFAGRELARMRQ
jgi:serine/threonine-protein kinase